MNYKKIIKNLDEDLIRELDAFREKYPIKDEYKKRLNEPSFIFHGDEILEEAIAALLSGSNLLLEGPKASGKNVLAENLAYLFNRPTWNVSFHINIDSNSLIGVDTFEDDRVILRQGPILESSINGGFCILDEINMAKNDSVAVLHSALDYRRMIDVPGYGRKKMDPSSRFIATMNYGYMGTRELNEALTSRFMVISMPQIEGSTLSDILDETNPRLKREYKGALIDIFMDLVKKSQNAEISSRSLDMRGLLSALETIKKGLDGRKALEMGLVNKTFDDFERKIVRDVINIHIPENAKACDFYE